MELFLGRVSIIMVGQLDGITMVCFSSIRGIFFNAVVPARNNVLFVMIDMIFLINPFGSRFFHTKFSIKYDIQSQKA